MTVLFSAILISLATGMPSALPQDESVVRRDMPFDPRPLMKKLPGARSRRPVTSMHFLVFGDAKHSRHFTTVLKHAASLRPDFSITTADLVQKGAGKSGVGYYKRLEEQAGWFLRKFPTWPTVGNHEESGGGNGVENFSGFFGLEGDLYSFEYGNAKFIALGWPKTHKEDRRLKWLEKELASGKGKHIFVYQHRPYYTVGHKSHSDVEGEPNAATRLFEKYGVRAVFSGHDHIYHRTLRNGVYYIISAGAGASIYDLKREDEALPGDVYYGRLVKAKSGMKYKVHTADGRDTNLKEAFYFVVSIQIKRDVVRLRMIDSGTKKVWDDAVLSGARR